MAYHSELNPIIWENSQLKPEIEAKIFEIVSQFIRNLQIKIKPADIHIVGSNASFNYTEHSDLDVHVIVNFDNVSCSEEVLQAYFNSEKALFNNRYDVSIKGIPVEVYVEDIKSNTYSNGIYSLFDSRWVKYPEPITDDGEFNYTHQIATWRHNIDKAIINTDKKSLENLLDTVYLMRKNSLSVDGEYGRGNKLFKKIRDEGLLDRIKDSIRELTSKELSLESFNECAIMSEIGKIDLD